MPRPQELVHDPTKPGYSAEALLDAGKDPGDVFAGEPVTEPWATRRSAFMASTLADRLAAMAPTAQVTDVTCHTDSCYIEVDFDSWDAMQASIVYVNYPMLGDRYVSAGHMQLENGRYRVSRYVFFEPGYSDPSAYEAWYLEHQEEKYAEWRQQGIPIPGPPPTSTP